MSESQGASGPQFRADRPVEQPAVRTTIVGGRPPGSGKGIGPIPRGIEVLVKKAAIDAAFRELLLEKRAEAAGTIGLALEPAEQMMLRAVAREQLEAVIDRTDVPEEHRRAFLGSVAAAMLAALGLIEGACIPTPVGGSRPQEPPRPEPQPPAGPVEGNRPDVPPEPAGPADQGAPAAADQPAPDQPPPQGPPPEGPIRGIRPDSPVRGIQPEPPPPTGMRPDMPPGAAP